VNASGVDIAVAIDLSGSMASEDPGFRLKGQQANRLQIAKDVLKELESEAECKFYLGTGVPGHNLRFCRIAASA
jgi:hypothetical protein